ncbi:MAG TPA: hypothetical protein VIA06_06355 [Candidatus Dormibacteraeota bacterium]|jgi:hypothetical protein|nr:hypothetical protein [Candidatus Dormibacteraeota bacterium]
MNRGPDVELIDAAGRGEEAAVRRLLAEVAHDRTRATGTAPPR